MTITGAVILAIIAATLHWKKRAPRFVAWLLAFAGLGLAATIMKYVGGFTKFSVLGVGILTVTLIVCGIAFWEEAVKRNGLHRVRTPIVALLLGVSLATAGGTIGSLAHGAGNTGGQNINKAVTTLFNSKG
jgi:hypothetical protein